MAKSQKICHKNILYYIKYTVKYVYALKIYYMKSTVKYMLLALLPNVEGLVARDPQTYRKI